jgi:spore germination protein GerM
LKPRVGNSLALAGLVGLWALVTFTAPRWARYFREPLAARDVEGAPESSAGTEATAAAKAAEPSEPQRRISVKLFFEAPDRRGLVIEDRSVAFSSDLTRQIRLVVEELIHGSQAGLVAPFSPGTRVLEVFVTARGVAYVDLSKEIAENQVGGSESELLSVYSVVNSITANFPAVRRVQLLVDDHPTATLAGHVDLSRPLTADMTLLAVAPVSEASPSPAPDAAPTPAS